MKIELSIADDRELRQVIKDEIKGTVVSIARGEIKGILADVLREGVVPKSKDDFDKIVNDEIRKMVREEMQKTEWGDSARVRSVAREEVGKLIKELIEKKSLL